MPAWLRLIRLRRGGGDGKRRLQSYTPLQIDPRVELSAAGMCTIRGGELFRLVFSFLFFGFHMKEIS